MFNLILKYKNNLYFFPSLKKEILKIDSSKFGIVLLLKDLKFTQEKEGILEAIQINDYLFNKLPIFFSIEDDILKIIVMKTEFKP